MALYYRGRHCMQLVDQRQGVVLQGKEGINSSASEEFRYQNGNNVYGSVHRGSHCMHSVG